MRLSTAPATPLTIDEASLARAAVAQLDLTPITVSMAPKPNPADPNVLIGAPAYFWAEGGPPTIGPIGTTNCAVPGLSIVRPTRYNT